MAAVVLIVGGYWAYYRLGMNAVSGESISSQARFWIRVVVAALVLSTGLTFWAGYDEFLAISTAVWLVASLLLVGNLIALAVWLISFRKSRMEAAYKEYDELAEKGSRPCLVLSSLFGPRVVANYPKHMHTNLLMWSEGGGLRAYATTTQEHLDRARKGV